MAAPDELIAQVQDDNLRGQLQDEFRKLLSIDSGNTFSYHDKNLTEVFQ